jgi:hypothetical protein
MSDISLRYSSPYYNTIITKAKKKKVYLGLPKIPYINSDNDLK